jgi:hypothetical protein
MIIVCAKCGNEKKYHPSDIKAGRGKYCSTKCHHADRYNGKNYKRIGNAQTEHRILAENALGKKLPAASHIHHLNGGRNGGTLVICQDAKYHHLLHVRTNAYKATGDPNKGKCVFCKQWDDVVNMTISKNRTYHKKCNTIYEHNRTHRLAREQQKSVGL